MSDVTEDSELPATTTDSTALVALHRNLSPSLRIMLDERLYSHVKRLAGIMSKDTVFTPRHLVGKPEACFTVMVQSINWNLDPQFVARCTYQTPGGAIGFEGKLVQAVLEKSGSFIGAPKVTYSGDWSRVIGKFTKATSQKGNEYIKVAWTEKDAEGLGIIVRWQVKGEAEPRVWPGDGESFYLTQCYPLSSPLWATDARTQIRYLAMRRFADGAAPGILGGMSFDFDELLDASEKMRDITPETPARPTRADFAAGPVTDVAETPPIVWEIVNMIGEVATYDDMGAALDAYQTALDEAEKQKRDEGLRLVYDNNAGLFQTLDENGHADLSRELSADLGERRQAAHASEVAAQADAAKMTEAATSSATGQPAEIPRGTESAPPPKEPDRVWWGRDNLTIIGFKSNNEFVALLHQRLREARTEGEVECLSDANGNVIDALPKSTKEDALGRIMDRRVELRR